MDSRSQLAVPHMHHVTITREPGFVVDRARAYQVYVDHKKVLDIYQGAQRHLTLSPGVHALSLRLDWCRSQLITFDAKGGQSTTLWCWPNVRPYTWPFFLTFGRARYIAVSEQPRIGRAPSTTLFRMYQVALLVAVLAFIGHEVVLGKSAALALLVPVAILAILARMIAIRGTKIERNESGDG